MAIVNSFLYVYHWAYWLSISAILIFWEGQQEFCQWTSHRVSTEAMVPQGRILLKRGGYVTTNELILSLKMWNPPLGLGDFHLFPNITVLCWSKRLFSRQISPRCEMLPDLKVVPEHLLTFGTEVESRHSHRSPGGKPPIDAILEGKTHKQCSKPLLVDDYRGLNPARYIGD